MIRGRHQGMKGKKVNYNENQNRGIKIMLVIFTTIACLRSLCTHCHKFWGIIISLTNTNKNKEIKGKLDNISLILVFYDSRYHFKSHFFLCNQDWSEALH